MTTMVCFRASGNNYCVPVDSARSVRTAEGLIPLPAAREHVAGVVAGSPPLTVISPLGSVAIADGQILVLETGHQLFGLLVDSVIGIRRVDVSQVRPAPSGQTGDALIAGTVDVDGQLVFIADPKALGARL